MAALAVAPLGACSGDVESAGPFAPAEARSSMTVWNRSQYALAELRVHTAERFEGHPNLADDGIEEDGHVFLTDFQSGSYVTVIRERFDGGEQMAVTTSEPVSVDSSGYTLVVFDVSFRLLDPESVDNPFADTETPDP